MTEKEVAETEKASDIIKEFFSFLLHEKKWWLIPLVAILVLMVVLMVVLDNSPLIPFLYPTH